MTDSEKLDFLIAEFSKFGGRVDRLEGRFDRFETRLDGFESRLDKLEGRFDGFETRLDGFESRLDKLEGRFDKLEGTVSLLADQLTRLRVDVMARIDRLQEEVRGLKDDSTMNAGAAARLWKMVERNREDEGITQELIIALQRRVRGIDERLRVVEERG